MTRRAVAAEFLGTLLLLVAVVGSGIATATDGAASTQLFQHAVVVGAALTALIVTLGPISGAHFNPAVTVVDAWFGGLSLGRAAGYVVAQLLGAVAGVVLANGMFGEPLVALSGTGRTGGTLVVGEVVATFGLVLVIFGTVRSGNLRAVPATVGAYIAAAIFFTSSASFANPAVTVARALTDTYTGIAAGGIPGFIAGQGAGAVLAAVAVHWLFHPGAADAANVVVPHDDVDLERSSHG